MELKENSQEGNSKEQIMWWKPESQKQKLFKVKLLLA